jgi:uncharacterized protein (DUF3820 family)
MLIPYGKHAGKRLEEIPGDYLDWFARTQNVGRGLAVALAAELARRGFHVSPLPPPLPEPTCPTCGPSTLTYWWTEDSAGRRRIRRECVRCQRYFGFAPEIEPFVSYADGTSSETPLLDVLTEAEAQGVALRSNGLTAEFVTPQDEARASPGLRRRLRQCRARLGRMMGPSRGW